MVNPQQPAAPSRPTPLSDIGLGDLRQIYLFSGFDDEQLAAIKHTMRVLSLVEGERLFDHGQPARNFFFVRKGQLKLFRVSPEGDEKVIEIVRGGETFAEAVMFMERKGGYPVSAEAIEVTEAWSFDEKVMLSLLRESVD